MDLLIHIPIVLGFFAISSITKEEFALPCAFWAAWGYFSATLIHDVIPLDMY